LSRCLALIALLAALAAACSSNNANNTRNQSNGGAAGNVAASASTVISRAPTATPARGVASAGGQAGARGGSATATRVAAASPAAASTPGVTVIRAPAVTPGPLTVNTVDTSPQLPVTVTDKDGRPVTITDISRIVALSGDLTETVYDLGLGQNVVGVDASSTYPSDATRLPSLGNRTALTATQILALRPTLVLGNADAGPASALDQVRAAGVPVLLLQSVTSLSGIAGKLTAVAQALGVPSRGSQLVSEVDEQIEAAKTVANGAPSQPRVVFLDVSNPNGPMIWGLGTAADSMITAANAIDAAAATGISGVRSYTGEALVSAMPDVILTTTAALQQAGGVNGLLQLAGVAETPAGETRTIIAFDEAYLLGMGPRAGQALQELAFALHPELQ
jgi:iron complex transport system substrate-binding protein